MTQKTMAYVDLLSEVLPYVRNVETWSVWRRLRRGGAYAEAELVHNVPRCLVEPDFGKEDMWWLNRQARNYLQGKTRHALHYVVAAAVRKLFALVPSELRDQLEWEGPNQGDCEPPTSR